MWVTKFRTTVRCMYMLASFAWTSWYSAIGRPPWVRSFA